MCATLAISHKLLSFFSQLAQICEIHCEINPWCDFASVIANIIVGGKGIMEYPSEADIPSSEQLVCQVCSLACKTFKSLGRHLLTKHDLAVEWVKEAEKRERRSHKCSDLEKACVGLVKNKAGAIDEHFVACLLCTSNPTMLKQSLGRHFHNCHGFDSMACKHWLSLKDGRLLKNNKGEINTYVKDHLQFTRGVEAQCSDDSGDDDGRGKEEELDYNIEEQCGSESSIARSIGIEGESMLPLDIPEVQHVKTFWAPTPKAIARKDEHQQQQKDQRQQFQEQQPGELQLQLQTIGAEVLQLQQQQQQQPQQPILPEQEVSPLQMLGSIYAFVESKKDSTSWKRSLPKVVIKEKYLNLAGPMAKGEGVSRATWPKHLGADFVKCPSFNQYLGEHLNKKGDTAEKIITGVGRALGFLDIEPNPAKPDVQADDIEVLIALYCSGTHMQLLKSPLLNPKYRWSHEVMNGLAVYCEYHTKELRKNMLIQPMPHFEEFQAVVANIRNDFTGGYHKRCLEFKAEAHRLKQDADLALVKNISIPVLQAAVFEGYKALKQIANQYQSNQLPRNIRGLANSAIAGGIAFDTFCGRKREWELLDYDYVKEVLDNDEDFVICSHHKTAKTYGSIAKLLTPGLFEALLCYSKLHRPAGISTFLVPAGEGTCISLPWALRQFGHVFLAGKACPTFNLMRKLFHRHLMLLHGDMDKLKDLMVVLDAHSRKIQESHYILKDYSDDIKLAKELVKAILGKTVRWPNDNTDLIGQQDIVSRIERAPDTAADDLHVDGDDDEELEYFDGAEKFGVQQVSIEDLPMPLMDIEADAMEGSSGCEEGQNKKVKKDKKEKKAKKLLKKVKKENKTKEVVKKHIKHEQEIDDNAEKSANDEHADHGGGGEGSGDIGGAPATSTEPTIGKRGRASLFSDEQKKWIQEQQADWSDMKAAPNPVLRAWVYEGQSCFFHLIVQSRSSSFACLLCLLFCICLLVTMCTTCVCVCVCVLLCCCVCSQASESASSIRTRIPM